MSMRARRIAKVIIAGQWYTVKLGTFEVIELEVTDDEGSPLHAEPLEIPAYHFLTENGDEYYGPLTAIDLYKLIDV